MAVQKLLPAFSLGEVSPSLYGRFDLARLSVAASTARNGFVRYTGGWSSRAGTKFVGFSKQTGRDYPPRVITFQFSINQGLMLEFGNFYMRVVSNGAYITESPLSISGITNANPAVISSNGSGATAATPITSGVISTYAPGDTVTLAGGTYLTQTVLDVTNTKLVSLLGNAAGSGYVPTNTINLAGGTQSVTPVVTVTTTKVSALPAIAAAGAGGTPGTATVTGTTGTGTKFQATVTISGGGAITSVDSLTVTGSYTVNPTSLTNEPVTGGGLAGAQLSIVMGVDTFSITNAGVFTANASGGNFTQASTSGSGTGATFQQGIFGPNACTISVPGVYSVTPSNPVAQDTSSGTGLGATFTMTFASVAGFNDGDWVYVSGVGGMTEVNGQTYVVKNATSTDFEITDVYGNNINSTTFGTYTSGGTVARIYTVTAPYAEQDLAYLKFVQSKDVMSICCINQETLTEYPPYDLTRFSNTNWQFVLLDTNPSVDPPTALSGSASSSGSTWYQYQVTSVNSEGIESIASSTATISSAVNIAATAGAITLTWTPPTGINQFNVYKATPQFNTSPPVGALFGFAGYAFGAQFIDSNITADFTQVPPLAKNPFARGRILGASTVTAGTGYTTATATINTSTGSGAELQCIIVNGGVVAFLLITEGQDYDPDADTVTITGNGAGATAVLQFGPATGTYPGTVTYFQERRGYAYTLNLPDTYFFSQPGAFKNFDSRIPTIDSDAIIGSPWSVQVNGIQWMVPMPGGLVVMTGQSAWQLTGNGGSSLTPQPLTPTTQQVQPQAFNGVHSHVPPQRIDNDIIYVQAKGSIYRNLSYELLSNIYTGTDLTLNSSQLFTGLQVVQHAWCEEPFKTLWSVRSDGAMNCLTFVKSQEVAGWTRHDTNGYFVSVCSVTELPVDVLYCAVQRFPNGNTAYMIERMDDRIWDTREESWCVDCGLAYPQPTPAAILTASSATGLGAIASGTVVSGGSGWSDGTTGTIVDDDGNGPGTGAVPTLTFTNGVLTAVTFAPGSEGTGYVSPRLVLTDPQGSAGGQNSEYEVTLTLDNSATFTASASVFALGNVGDVIRMGGGVATITAYTSGTEVTANITTPITALRPNTSIPSPAASGDWTLTTPTTTVTGLNYLAGATVTGLADGEVISPIVVPANGEITLDTAASAIIIGLGFTAQLQTVYLNMGDSPTVQGQRKKVAGATFRVEASGPFKVGANQPDGSTLSPMQLAPEWIDLKDADIKSMAVFGSTTKPLYTGDTRVMLPGGFDTKGQVCVQQDQPLPLNLLAMIVETMPGDEPELRPQRQRGQ